MTENHPITPPPEMAEKYMEEMLSVHDIVTQAARWGADQELEACIQWIQLHFDGMRGWCDDLRAARRGRPKPEGLYNEPTFETDRKALAAALRAAVDKVVPESREHHPATFDEKHRKVSAFDVRNQLLAIAGSLENQ